MEMKVGDYNKLPHYAVVGNSTEFYVWVNEDGKGDNSSWVRGSEAFKKWHKLKHYRAKDKQKFIAFLKMIYLHNSKK